jgi:hypothetical protein
MMLVRAETEPGLDRAVAKARETLRFEAAKAAAPYVHPRLQAVTLGGDPEIVSRTDERRYYRTAAPSNWQCTPPVRA